MTHDAERLDVLDELLVPGVDLPIGRLGGLTRRQMLKFCAGVAATMGLSQAAGVRMALAAENPKRPPVIWLHGQECTGCTETLLRAYHPTLESLLLDVISPCTRPKAAARSKTSATGDSKPASVSAVAPSLR